MDLNSEGSNPSLPSIYHNPYAYLIAHVNLALRSKKRLNLIVCTKKVLRLIKTLRREGCLTYLLLKQHSQGRRHLIFTPYYYKQTTFFKRVQLISTISKKFTISFKALTILDKSLKNSILLIETSRGIITHKEALRCHIGGLLLCLIS